MWAGCLTALVTPFRHGALDLGALEKLVEQQIAGGINGLVPCGSTGESATLTHDEHIEVVQAVIGFARGRTPVIAGTGSNSTAEAIRLTRAAEDAGAAGALLLSPYYNKPTQEGIYEHYAAVAEATKLPILIYNIPGRTASNILPETIARLSRIRNVVGVKEASGSIAQVVEIVASAEPGFKVYSGDDVTILPIMAVGGAGAIAVSSNVAPRRLVQLTDALLAGDLAGGRRMSTELLPLVRALTMSFEVNPIPVKTAVALMGGCAEEFRLPLTRMNPANRERLQQTLREYQLV
jgi:4-hydroxy-tetrahydrodipicolinate synthase